MFSSTETFLTKENFLNECKKMKDELAISYSNIVESLKNKGIVVEFQLLFYSRGKYYPIPRKSNGRIKVKIYVFSSNCTRKQAIKKNEIKRIYSILGNYSKVNDEYQVVFFDKNDNTLKKFLYKINKNAEIKNNFSLKQTLVDVFRSYLYFNRYGSDYDRYYRSIPMYWVVVIIIIVIFLFRLIVPTGYHPSIR